MQYEQLPLNFGEMDSTQTLENPIEESTNILLEKECENTSQKDSVELEVMQSGQDEVQTITEIDGLFTENDLNRFGKGRKGWHGNAISRNKFSDLRIENPVYGNDVNAKHFHYRKDWIDNMIEKMYEININLENESISKGNINDWLYTKEIHEQFDSLQIRKYMRSKLHVSLRVYKTNITMFKKIVPLMMSFNKKELNDFKREDYLNPEVIKMVIDPLNSMELIYYQSFLNSLKPFKKVKLDDYVDKINHKTKFDHPLVRVVESVLKKERNIKPQSFHNNYYIPVRTFVNWAISSLVKFQNQSINTFIFNMVTSEDLDDYKSFLIKQVKEEELTEITAKRNLQYVRSFLQLLFRKKKIVRDVTRNLTNIKADEYFYRRLPPDEEIQELINAIEHYSSNPIGDKLALSLMLLMGFRGCEVASLSWKDINLSTRSISITDTKGMDAILPIPTKVYDLLILYQRKSSDKKHIFCDNPKSFTPELRLLFDSYQLIAGWDYGGGLHLYRHLFVTRLIMHCPQQIVKSLTRHISDDTVAKYVHFERKFVKNELEKLSYIGG
ncbi:tyrosine-type recombinase/integrase [Pontibacillus yanchengensis]